MMAVARAACPACRRKVELEPQMEKGEWVNCPHCLTDLEVIGTSPPALDWAYDDEVEIVGYPRIKALGDKRDRSWLHGENNERWEMCNIRRARTKPIVEIGSLQP